MCSDPGCPRKLLLACSYHTGNAGCERRRQAGRYRDGFSEKFSFGLTMRSVDPLEVKGRELYPSDTLIPLITAAHRVIVIKRKTIGDLNTPHTDAHFIV